MVLVHRRYSILVPWYRCLLTFVYQFARYLTQELHSGEYLTSDASDDEDDEDDGGWLAQSTFDLGKPPPARRHNNGQSSSRFEVGVILSPTFVHPNLNEITPGCVQSLSFRGSPRSALG